MKNINENDKIIRNELKTHFIQNFVALRCYAPATYCYGVARSVTATCYLLVLISNLITVCKYYIIIICDVVSNYKAVLTLSVLMCDDIGKHYITTINFTFRWLYRFN